MSKRIALPGVLMAVFLLVSVLFSAKAFAAAPGAGGDEEFIGLSRSVTGTYVLLDNPGEEAAYVDIYLQQLQQAYPVIYNGYADWKLLMEAIGGVDALTPDDYSYIEGIEVKHDGNLVIANAAIRGRERTASIEFRFDASTQDVLSITMNPVYTFGEQMGMAGMNTLVGMGVVFIVLILISLIIGSFGIFHKLREAKELPEEPTLAEKSMKSIVSQIAEREEGDLELIAVLTAAIAAYEGNASPGDFVVRSVRKVKRA